MSYRLFRAVAGMFAALILLCLPVALARAGDTKPAEQVAAAAVEPAKTAHKTDEYAEAQHALAGAAGNPECVWLGRRVVGLLWRDDLDTAFRHLDLYDRFGCPSAHIQTAFRCLILHGSNIDPKAADSLNARVQACWLNPSAPVIPLPAAAAPSPTSNR